MGFYWKITTQWICHLTSKKIFILETINQPPSSIYTGSRSSCVSRWVRCSPRGVTSAKATGTQVVSEPLLPSPLFLFISENWLVSSHPHINTLISSLLRKSQLKLPVLVLRWRIEICTENKNYKYSIMQLVREKKEIYIEYVDIYNEKWTVAKI